MAEKKDPRLAAPLDSNGPGAHLRKVREETDVTIDKVAATLLLDTATVEALEADAYDRLPAPTFVRGYLRGYARVLGLPSGPILDMYNRQGFEPPPLSPEVTESKQAHPSDAMFRLVTYSVAAVLVLLVGLWWHSQEDGGFGIGGELFGWSEDAGRDPTAAATDESGAGAVDGEAGDGAVAMAPGRVAALPGGDRPVPPSPAGDTAPGDPDSTGAAPGVTGTEGGSGEAAAPGEPLRDEGASAATAPVENVAAGGIVVAGPAPAEAAIPGVTADREAPATRGSGPRSAAEAGVDAGAGTGGEAGADRADGGSPAPASDSDIAGGGNAPAPESSGGTDVAGETAGASSAAAPVSETAGATADTGTGTSAEPRTFRSGLVLEFEHESWVEVYDGDRSRLFFGLVQPGRVLSFDGPQPFDVLLGFGKDVRVAIDGQAFDHTPYLKHGVGRFSVGSSPDAGPDTGASTGATAPDVDSPDGSPRSQDGRA